MLKKLSILFILILFLYPMGLYSEDNPGVHQAIQARSLEIFNSIVKIRRDIHQYPETSGNEKRTSALVAGYLKDLGLEVISGVGGYGVIGILKTGRPGPTIGWRADMDALATNMSETGEFASKIAGIRHICGHDVHTVIALGIADVLTSIKDQLRGSVVFIFQPSEENFQGARAMIRDGLFKKVKPDVLFGLHIAPFASNRIAVRPGEMFAYRALILKIVLKKSALAAPAQKELVDFIKAMSTHSRESLTSITQFTDLGKGILSPDTHLKDYFFVNDQNLKMEETGIHLVIRAEIYSSAKRLIEDNIQKLKTSGWAGAINSIEYSGPDWGIPVTNHPSVTQQAREAIRSIYGPDSVLPIYGVTPLFNDDFALFQNKIPGVYFFLGGSNKEKGIISMPHSPGFAVDEACIRTGINYFSSLITTRLVKK